MAVRQPRYSKEEFASERPIDEILLKDQRRVFMQKLKDAYKEQANDSMFQKEISLWDITAEDGLNP
jgi:hypothetical protein